MPDLILGYGEVGKAVQEAVSPKAHIYDPKIRSGRCSSVDVMHVCFPYSEDFVKLVQGYIVRYEPTHIAIWSTVPIGTTKKLPKAIHTPVEGKHPKLAKSIKLMTRWVGYNDKPTALFFEEYFKKANLRTKLVKHTNNTEALKLLSTTEYGLNIEYARYKKWVTDKLGMDFELTKQWNRDYNQLYRELEPIPRFQKFILDPPKGKKGGHCVTPNAQLLYEQYPSELVKIVGEI